MTDLTKLTITGALSGLKAKDFTASELVESHISSCEANTHLNAFITTTFDQAREAAKAADKAYQAGDVRILEGVPIGMKDLFCTKGVQTTASSKILKGFVPTYESTVSQNLKDAGTISLGKLSLDQFAMGSANITSAYGNVISPIKARGSNADLVPGGSSGGSAAAVAAHMVMGATGTDTGGSIRQPAAFCGLYGIKPTYGRCSRWGIIAFASSLDQAGPLARSVEDCALLLEAMAGFDEKDSTSANLPVPNFSGLLGQSVSGKTIGIPKEYRVEGLDAEIDSLWDEGIAKLKDAGAKVVEISLPHSKYALPVYYILAPAEASSNLARYDGVRYGLRVEGKDLTETYELTRAEGFGDEVKRRILIGTFVLSAGYYDAYYGKAQRVRKLIAQDFDNVFDKVDAILTPTTPTPAFSFDNIPTDPVTMYLNDVLTIPASLAGLPAMSIPAGTSKDGLPLGLQLIGRRWEEETILNLAQVF